MPTRKFNYWRVIQQNFAGYWEDVSQYEARSNGLVIDRPLFRADLKEYQMTGPTRSIFRKELA